MSIGKLKKAVSVKVKIIPKDGNRALLPEIYGGKGYCEGIDPMPLMELGGLKRWHDTLCVIYLGYQHCGSSAR